MAPECHRMCIHDGARFLNIGYNLEPAPPGSPPHVAAVSVSEPLRLWCLFHLSALLGASWAWQCQEFSTGAACKSGANRL